MFSVISGIQTDPNLIIRLSFILKKKKKKKEKEKERDWIFWSVVDVWDHR